MCSKWAKGSSGQAGDEHHSLLPVYALQAGCARENPGSGPGGLGIQSEHAYTLEARSEAQIIAFPERMSATQCASAVNLSPALGARNPTAFAQALTVRRLTPLECERLMGFPDHYTNVPHRGKPAADGPRYKALGNSWAINCARFVGERIQAVDAISARLEPA
ncbi:MAG: DNA cytosine methyltransferase [Pseudomonadota bacterium]|nr:DNA cytosine methyltransferase [Pseudomonadota bacterium]